MNQKVISTGYVPRPLQQREHNNLDRFNVLVCHRRFGKTIFAINEIIDQMLRCDHKRPQAAYLAPTFGAAKRIAWEYLKEFTQNIPGVKKHEGELRLDIPRPWRGDFARIMLLGSENPHNLRGIYLDFAVLDEYGEMSPEVWSQVIRPALSDRQGGGIFVGTVRGDNHFWQLYLKAQSIEGWHTAIYKASETDIIPESELKAARDIMDPAEYEQEFECDVTAALKGAYYGDQMNTAQSQDRIGEVPYDSGHVVHTAWDIGLSDMTAIWFFQQVGQSFKFIDYYENSDKALDHYAQVLNDKEYNYGTHYMPHDMGRREISTGKERSITLRNLGLKSLKIVPKSMSVADDINAVRMMLSRCYWDDNKCHKGISALKNYQRKWDSKEQVYSKTPLHNWASHGADAFRTFAIGVRDEFGIKNTRRYTETDSDYNVLEA